MTVEQFRQLPESGEFTYELQAGKVAVTRPKPRHWKLQRRLSRLVEPKLKAFEVAIEVPFRPFPGVQFARGGCRGNIARAMGCYDPDDDLCGAPELVIEIKSPSNTHRKLRELVSLCLENGAIEGWILDPNKKTVAVTRGTEATVT